MSSEKSRHSTSKPVSIPKTLLHLRNSSAHDTPTDFEDCTLKPTYQWDYEYLQKIRSHPSNFVPVTPKRKDSNIFSSIVSSAKKLLSSPKEIKQETPINNGVRRYNRGQNVDEYESSDNEYEDQDQEDIRKSLNYIKVEDEYQDWKGELDEYQDWKGELDEYQDSKRELDEYQDSKGELDEYEDWKGELDEYEDFKGDEGEGCDEEEEGGEDIDDDELELATMASIMSPSHTSPLKSVSSRGNSPNPKKPMTRSPTRHNQLPSHTSSLRKSIARRHIEEDEEDHWIMKSIIVILTIGLVILWTPATLRTLDAGADYIKYEVVEPAANYVAPAWDSGAAFVSSLKPESGVNFRLPNLKLKSSASNAWDSGTTVAKSAVKDIKLTIRKPYDKYSNYISSKRSSAASWDSDTIVDNGTPANPNEEAFGRTAHRPTAEELSRQYKYRSKEMRKDYIERSGPDKEVYRIYFRDLHGPLATEAELDNLFPGTSKAGVGTCAWYTKNQIFGPARKEKDCSVMDVSKTELPVIKPDGGTDGVQYFDLDECEIGEDGEVVRCNINSGVPSKQFRWF